MPPNCFGLARAENGREQQQNAREKLNTPLKRPSQQSDVNKRPGGRNFKRVSKLTR